MSRPVLAVWLFSAIIVAPRAQAVRDSPARTGQTVAISGRVVADDTGDPLPNARVTLTPASAGTRVVLSDAEGRFTLSASAGRHTVVASKSGYARRELTMNAGGDALEIRLPRGAAMSGRVVDEFGDPVMAARVTAETRSPTGTTTVATTDTDDRGEYRLASLPPGAFVVAVTTIGAMVPTNVGNNAIAMIPTPRKGFYPGTGTATEAEELRLEPGDD
jgi:protocatechuate 3,4-dioxygenase beta subunit